MPVLVAAFYRFTELADYRALRAPLQALCLARDVRGTVLLAPEGINGTLAGAAEDVKAVLAALREHPQLTDLEHKASSAPAQPFQRLKVRLKREIISMGVDGIDARRTGTTIPVPQWNRLIADPDVLVIDTRNEYEVAVGSFKHAISPGTGHFGEFPRYVRDQLDPARHKRIAMFCTGGIRCEKASAYLLAQGFSEVYQLQGGILNYLEQVDPADSLWQGECFVFDQRVAVGHGVTQGGHTSCRACGQPQSEADRASPDYRHGLHCRRCRDSRSEQQLEAARERQRQEAAAERSTATS